MQAATYSENGGPEVLRYQELPDPVPGRGEVLVRTEAISIEGGDLGARRMMPVTDAPHVPGLSAAGTVVALGEGVADGPDSPGEGGRPPQVGDRVATFYWSGSHASLRAVPVHYLYPVPDGVSMDVASTVPVALGTADDALFRVAGLEPGQTVLVRGATGGVGCAAVQLAAATGAHVLATCSGTGRAQDLSALGAEHVIDHRTEDVVGRVQELTDGNGVDLLLDMAGGPEFVPALGVVARGGRVVIGGAAGGDAGAIPVGLFGQRSLTVSGVVFGLIMHEPAVHERIARSMRRVAAGELRMPIARTFPLSEAAAAHVYMETGHPLGRVIMVP